MRPLHIAAQFNAQRTAAWLLEQKVELTATTTISGDTAIHIAARMKSFGIYKALVAAGADVNRKNLVRETPRQLMYDSDVL